MNDSALVGGSIRWRVLLLAVMVGVACAGRVARADGPAPGETLDASTWRKAENLLPPEILKHYENGDYKNRVVEYPVGFGKWEETFLDATKKNIGTLDVDERGALVDKATRKQPDYYYGLPFPEIDEKDPNAGVKIVWNQFLAYWYSGNTFNERSLVAMLRRGGLDRAIEADGWFQFFDGQAPRYRIANPLNLQSRFLGNVVNPADLQGTASLTWRYREPDKRDSVWAYVPALRRVRAVTPSNRSDGYLGSDISGDDGFFFDGKPEDFTWKLIGKREGMRMVDPNSLNGSIVPQAIPGGGWNAMTDLNPPTVGYKTPGWTGAPWAPVDPAIAKRTFWVVEGRPRDRYYLYGRLELWIDAETYDGAWNRKFDWKDELINVYQMQARVNQPAGPADAREYIPVSTMTWACAENFKMDRATLGGMRPDPKARAERRMPIEDKIFDSASLARLGK